MKNPMHEISPSNEKIEKYAEWRKNEEMKNLKKLVKIDDYEKRIENENYREPLCYQTTKIVKIQLSWGGDGDGYRLEMDEEDNICRACYYWEDWGVYKEIELTNEEWLLVEQVYNATEYI